jgi:hypothetical protein
MRMKEFRKIHMTITAVNIEIKSQEPPKEATLSAIFCPKVIFSERSRTTFVEMGVLLVI